VKTTFGVVLLCVNGRASGDCVLRMTDQIDPEAYDYHQFVCRWIGKRTAGGHRILPLSVST